MTRGGRRALELSGCLFLLLLAPAGASGGATGSPGCRGAKGAQAPATDAPPAADAPLSKDAVFRSEIRPILVAHCAPCHEPGGKLYAKLPFDDPAVLSSHGAGVKKRLKGDDLEAFERWLAMPPGKS